MVELVKNNLDKIIGVCKEHHVKSLYLFGSGARGDDFTENSDLDFLVDFAECNHKSNEEVLAFVHNLDKLKIELQKITNRKVDLIQERNIRNKYLRYFINKDKRMLYGLS